MQPKQPAQLLLLPSAATVALMAALLLPSLRIAVAATQQVTAVSSDGFTPYSRKEVPGTSLTFTRRCCLQMPPERSQTKSTRQRHPTGQANEGTRISHTVQLTVLQHVAGLTAACTAREMGSSDHAKAGVGCVGVCCRRDGCRSMGRPGSWVISAPQKLAHGRPGVRAEWAPAHDSPGMCVE